MKYINKNELYFYLIELNYFLKNKKKQMKYGQLFLRLSYLYFKWDKYSPLPITFLLPRGALRDKIGTKIACVMKR